MKQKTPRSKKGSNITSRTRTLTRKSRSTKEALSPEVLPALQTDQDSEATQTPKKLSKKMTRSEALDDLEELENSESEHDEEQGREELEEPTESDLESTGVPKNQS